MKNKSKINFYNFLFFFALYVSLIVGFLFDENLNYGGVMDWVGTNHPVINAFANDFKNSFLEYEKFGHRHSPIYLIFLSFFSKIGFPIDLIRFIHLNISLLLIYYFYKCLILQFNNIDRNVLILLSLSIFLSPTFRTLSIWPDTRIIGLIFFLISVYYFLKFRKEKKIIYFWKNIIFLIISSYISPNFSLFIIYFFYYYLKNVSFDKIFFALLFCLISSFPALYYIFIMDVNFLMANTPGIDKTQTISLDFNLSNKILIISSIIFFQLTPFLINKEIIKSIILLTKKNFFYIVLFLSINIFFFNYVLNYTGGGFYFQISNYFFNDNNFFYLVCFISLALLYYFISKNLNNLLIFVVLISSNIQNTIYHKYYDPLIMILLFTIINNKVAIKFLESKNNLIYLYSFYSAFILLRIVKNTFFLV